MKKSLIKKILFAIFLILILIAISRATTHREIDDVSPGIYCEPEYLEKSDILWVIPKYKDIPISDNQTWCQEILAMNKTLGMHGITHHYREFELEYISEYQLNEGIRIFEECFNQTPEIFKSPQIHISKKNIKQIGRSTLKLKHYFNQIVHKVYHCSDTGTLSNKFHDTI